MSSYTHIYIGIYLVVDQFIEIPRTKHECGNGHKRGRSVSGERNDFCGECGARFEAIEYTEKRRMDCHDAAEEFGFDEDTFQNVDRGDKPCIWIGNETSDSLCDDSYEGDYEINPETISNAVTEFAKKYMVPLELLDDNDVDYAVYFGTVVYQN